MTNESLNKKLIAALVENISLQREEKANHPRVCHYGFKTYSDKFEMYIPAMKELMGIICSLESHIEMFEHS